MANVPVAPGFPKPLSDTAGFGCDCWPVAPLATATNQR